MKIKWIDVKEKLPPGKGADQCIVCNEVNGTRLVLCAVWNGIDKVFYMIEEYGAFVEDEERPPTVIEHVSYWCELPNPPTTKRAEAQNTSTNSAMDAIAALRDLYEACMWADRDAMLPGNIDGKLLDRAKTVLQQHQ